MDIEQIDLGDNFARTCLQGSDRLVVSFESGGGSVVRPGKNRKAWGQELVASAGWDGLHILPKIMNWYQSPELWSFFKMMNRSGFFHGYKEVMSYGSSMGGFGALAFAKLSESTRVIAISPRSTLNKNTLRWNSNFSRQLQYNQKGLRADALSGLTPEIDVMIFVDPLYQRDMRHARRIANHHNKTNLVRVPLLGHEIPKFLSDEQILGQVSRSAIAGEFDKAWFYQAIRWRRESAFYHKRFEKMQLRRSKAKSSVV